MELIGTLSGFVLTMMVFSYLLGDNLLYRLAVYIFVGVASAFTTIVIVESILIPLLISGEVLSLFLLFTALILGLFLMFKSSIPFAWLTNSVFAFIITVGSVVAVVGAIAGTLLPLTLSTGTGIEGDLLQSIVMVIGVVTSLLYFQYLVRRTPDGELKRRRYMQVITTVGKGFIVVTLGAIYATAILTSLTIVSERMSFLINGG